MKRFALVVLALLLLAVNALAAGTVIASRYFLSQDGNQLVIKLACVGDAANGSVPEKTLNADALSYGLTKPYWMMGYYLYEVWTVTPASANPDAADVAITDALGATLFTQANVIASTVSTKTEGAVDKYRQVNSPMVVTQANQSTASATWDVYIKLSK
jgi:hypothetical protein